MGRGGQAKKCWACAVSCMLQTMHSCYHTAVSAGGLSSLFIGALWTSSCSEQCWTPLAITCDRCKATEGCISDLAHALCGHRRRSLARRGAWCGLRRAVLSCTPPSYAEVQKWAQMNPAVSLTQLSKEQAIGIRHKLHDNEHSSGFCGTIVDQTVQRLPHAADMCKLNSRRT